MKCVILAGGGGHRLWPLSRTNLPKQFLYLGEDKTLLQKTVLRNKEFFDKFMIITNERFADKTLNNMKEINLNQFELLLETAAKNTAPAITISALKSDPDEILLVVPADARIENMDEYLKAIKEGMYLAQQGYIITFGIRPTSAHTGYGYIKHNENEVLEFKEKPTLSIAQQYFKSGNYLWNSGMFMFKAKVLLEEMKKYRKDIYDGCYNLVKELEYDSISVLPKQFMDRIPSESIDYAVMEKSKKMKVVPSNFMWTDIGGLEALCETLPGDDRNNKYNKNAVINDSDNISIYNDSERLVVVNGLENVVVSITEDAIYISKAGKSQDIKSIINDNKNLPQFN